ncbi:hypothetical protein [Cohnella terricola]|uniref:Uncharacterized protein n=1 Tax=Cohnella terricola TaxID=1289167 RepID=A0A559IV62_9BACL|nr:hypothetical protein [Cohnella terricola]TVX91522.1 hypothetical protein FPZ45_24955 [Cohnella terricola]
MKLLYRGILFLFSIIFIIGCSKDDYPKDFDFTFKYGVMTKNVLNTFNGEYTKDLAMDGLISINYQLSVNDKKRIFEFMKDIDLFNYPDEVEGLNQLPSSGYEFEIQYNGKKKNIIWNGEFNDELKDQEFKELTRLIIGIIESSEDYRSLPESNGGYE